MVNTVEVFATTLAAEHVYFEMLEKLLENGGDPIDAMIAIAKKKYNYFIEPPGWGERFEDKINKIVIYPEKTCLEAFPEGFFEEFFACGYPMWEKSKDVTNEEYKNRILKFAEELGGDCNVLPHKVQEENGEIKLLSETVWCTLDEQGFEKFVKGVTKMVQPYDNKVKVVAVLK